HPGSYGFNRCDISHSCPFAIRLHLQLEGCKRASRAAKYSRITSLGAEWYRGGGPRRHRVRLPFSRRYQENFEARAQEAHPPWQSRVLAAAALRRAAFFRGAEPVDRGAVLSLGTLGGKRRARAGSLAAGRGRRLVADRRPDAVEGLPVHGASATRSCRRVLPVRLIPYYFLCLSQIVLQLAVSGWDRLRIPMEVRPLHLPPEFPVAALARHRAALTEVHPVELFRLRGGEHVRRGHCPIPRQFLRACRRCADAELLPLPGRHDSIRRPWASDCIDLRAELLVPLSVPLRSFPRTRISAQPGADHTQPGNLYRLRQGVPVDSAGRQAGADSLGRVHRMLGVRRGLSGRQHARRKLARGFANAPR